MSTPAWGQYDSHEYSDSLLSPGSCDVFDHCHHSTPENILCGVGYLDGNDSNFVSIRKYKSELTTNIINFPNPFNASTIIHYNLQKASNVEIVVYNILGMKLTTLVEGYQNSGKKSFRWEPIDEKGNPLPGGIYFYTIEIGELRKTKKMIFLK